MSSGRRTHTTGGDRRRGEDREETTSSRRLNEYFIKADGLNREVIQSEICRFLGPEATSRPAEYEGTRGYMIKAYRPFTSEMLKDLRDQSAQFEAERAAARKSRGTGREGMDYETSQTRMTYEPSDPRLGAPAYGSAVGTPYGQEAYGLPQGYGQVQQGYPSQPGYEATPYGQVSYPPGYSMSQPPPGIPPSAEPRYKPGDPRYPGQAPYGYSGAPPGGPGYLQPQQGYPDTRMDMGHNDPSGGQHFYGAPADRGGAGGPRDHNPMPGLTSSPGTDLYGQTQAYQRQHPSPYEQPSSRGGYSSRQTESHSSGGSRRR